MENKTTKCKHQIVWNDTSFYHLFGLEKSGYAACRLCDMELEEIEAENNEEDED